MAAIPSAINLIENHLSAENGAKCPYQIYKPLKGNNDKDLLLVGEAELEGGGGGGKADERNIRTQFNRIWPFQAMKFTNWFILLILAIGTMFCAFRQLYWSQFWKTTFRERPYNLAWEFSAGQWILFSLASISILASFMAKSGRIGLFFIALFALMDLCISAISIPILIILNTIFSLTALAEYRFYLPKLAHFNGTQEELLALTEMGDFGYFDSVQLHSYWRERRPRILFHLLADPLISFFAILAILLNIGLLICIAKMMRRAAIWKRANCEHPNCSQFHREYSAHYPFGMIKTLQWLLPLLVLFSFLYIPLFNLNYFNDHFVIGLGLISLICFGQWLFYFCKVHLLEGDHRLGPIFFIDWFISTGTALFFAISYSQQYSISQYQLAVYFLLFSLNFASICLLCRLLWRNPTICTNLHLYLPNISIQVQFNVNVVKNGDSQCSTKKRGEIGGI